MPHRFTISLAQLLLLAMLTALFCVWLPEGVWQNQQNQRSLTKFLERWEFVPSLDGTVLYSRAGQQGCAAFETASGKSLFSESLEWFEEPVFDPMEKQIAVLNRLQQTSYKIRVLNLVTGQSRHATSPAPQAGFEIDIHPIFSRSARNSRSDLLGFQLAHKKSPDWTRYSSTASTPQTTALGNLRVVFEWESRTPYRREARELTATGDELIFARLVRGIWVARLTRFR